MDDRTKLFLTLLLGVALLHAPSLAGGFVWDDHQMIVENPDLGDLGNVPSFFRTNYFGERANVELYRPLVNASLALDHAVWGITPFGYRLTNLLLHLLCGGLLYSLLRRITTGTGPAEAGALLFLVHPVSAEPVGWIVGRADLLAFALSMVTVHLHLSGRRRPLLHAAALLTWLAALFAKLSAAPLPLLVLLVEGFFRRDSLRPLLSPANLWRYASYALPVALYLVVREDAMGSLFPGDTGVTWRKAGDLAALFTGLAIQARSAFLFLFPVGMCADYSADPVFDDRHLSSVAEAPAVLAAAAAVPVAVIAAIVLRRRLPWLSFGTLWFFVALLPVSQVVRIGAVMADRFLYLPAAGGAALLGVGLWRTGRHRWLLGALVLASLCLLSYEREAVWRDDRTMNEDVLRGYPRNDRAWNRLGLYYAGLYDPEAKDLVKEEEAYRNGLAANPGNRYLRKNLGILLHETGRRAEALSELQAALSLSPRQDLQKAKIAWALARVLYEEDRKAEAALVLEEAVLCRPVFPRAFRDLALIYRRDLDRPDRADALEAMLEGD